jgi:predicted porin
MNKKLLAVAISAALVAPAAAMAGNVTVYGHAQVEVTDVNFEDDTATDGIEVADNARGRVGVKASEDLGNGLKSFAQFEWKADTTDNVTGANSSKAALTARVSQVGIKGGFGTISLGNLKSPYKYTGGVKYDAFVTTALEARRHGGMVGGTLGSNGFVADMVAYATPKGPITAAIAYGPEEDDGRVIWDVKYSAGGIEAFVAGVDNGDNSDYSATKVGGSFKTGSHKILVQYETVDSGVTGADDATILFLGYQMKMGKNTFVAQYGQQDDADFVADAADTKSVDGDVTYTSLGVIHKLSKTTRVFGGWRNTDTDDDGGESVITVGLRKDFKS